MTTPDFKTDIPILGKAKIISPLKRHIKKDEPGKRFVSDEERIIVDVQMDRLKTDVKQNSSFDQAGPREKNILTLLEILCCRILAVFSRRKFYNGLKQNRSLFH